MEKLNHMRVMPVNVAGRLNRIINNRWRFQLGN
jgi:hypothetical protein